MKSRSSPAIPTAFVRVVISPLPLHVHAPAGRPCRSRAASLSGVSDLVVAPAFKGTTPFPASPPDGRRQIPSYPVSSVVYEYLHSGGAFTVSRSCDSCRVIN